MQKDFINSGRRKINWNKVSRSIEILNGLASIVVILGVIGLYFQVKEFITNKFSRSAQLLGMYDQQLFMGTNPQIRYAIEDCKPILKINSGHFIENQLTDYLDVFESLSISSDKKLIENDMLYDDLGYYIDITYLNPEVQKYLNLKENFGFYDGFKALAVKSPYLKIDKSKYCDSAK